MIKMTEATCIAGNNILVDVSLNPSKLKTKQKHSQHLYQNG